MVTLDGLEPLWPKPAFGALPPIAPYRTLQRWSVEEGITVPHLHDRVIPLIYHGQHDSVWLYAFYF